MRTEGGGGMAMAAKQACTERANQGSRDGEGKGKGLTQSRGSSWRPPGP